MLKQVYIAKSICSINKLKVELPNFSCKLLNSVNSYKILQKLRYWRNTESCQKRIIARHVKPSNASSIIQYVQTAFPQVSSGYNLENIYVCKHKKDICYHLFNISCYRDKINIGIIKVQVAPITLKLRCKVFAEMKIQPGSRQ